MPTAKMASLPKGAATECADVPDNTYGDGMIADEAIRRLQAAKEKPGEPFFIAVGFLKPHLPFVAPKKYWDLYRPRGLPAAGAADAAAGRAGVRADHLGRAAAVQRHPGDRPA